MAKTLDEINDAIKEWQKENPKVRSVLLIAGYEENNIQATIRGPKYEIVENIATELIRNRVFSEAINQAIRMAFEYANEQTEDN